MRATGVGLVVRARHPHHLRVAVMLGFGLGVNMRMKRTHRELPTAGMVKLAVNLLGPLKLLSQAGQVLVRLQATAASIKPQPPLQQQLLLVLPVVWVGCQQGMWSTAAMSSWTTTSMIT